MKRPITLLVIVGATLLTTPSAAKAAQGGNPPSCVLGTPEINPANQPAQSGETVRLNVNTANATSYSWKEVTSFGVTLSTSVNGNLVGHADVTVPTMSGTVQVTVTATGCGGSKTSAPALITVTNPVVNTAPTARAAFLVGGLDVRSATVSEGESFTLDASGSTDPENQALTYSWEQVDGTAVYRFSDLPSNERILTLKAPAVPYPNGATFSFKLTVTDPEGLSSVDPRVTLTVKWVDDPPVARADLTFVGEGTYACVTGEKTADVNEGEAFVLDASRSTDADDGIASYLWNQIKGGPVLVLPNLQQWSGMILNGADVVAPKLANGHGDEMEFAVTVTDAAGEGNTGLSTISPVCRIKVLDVTPPVVTVPENITVEAAGPDGRAVEFMATALDAWDGNRNAGCDWTSPATFPIGSTTPGVTTVTCTATDVAGNEGSASFTVTVTDTTAPQIIVPAAKTVDPNTISGAAVPFSVSANDIVDGDEPVVCTASGKTRGTVVSGSSFAFGTTTVTCSATDKHGNPGTESFSVTVNGFKFLGFFQPISPDPAVFNSVKAGSTVPVKFKLTGQGGMEFTDIAAIKTAQATPVSCGVSPVQEVLTDVNMTGATVLRYDLSGAQFIFNWQTPKSPGACYRLDLTLADDSTHSAQFKLK